MKKLIGMYKSLPREARMMLAMAGLGTPAGMIYCIKKFLFPGWSWMMVMLVVFGVVLAISLLVYLISRVFGRGKRKRSKRMASDLAADDDRTAISGRAAIKANNEKFFNAIKEMRKGLGISIYELPWYIVMGDSGCGKTRLINEGGLTFSTGKPEGYQLGTLNYNWWFTEDAIFIDMAGRLCNPQDDSDHREWQAFLNTIAKGRKGYPINGALVCVSADHLLQDSPEKVEQDANTALERLRDLQNKLGVTFATYLVITKCDKILGFMQFFDRAERDIRVKGQIVGWSRPGDFHELFDPEQFDGEFNGLYERLNELRLRRLNDEVDEIDLGLAYSFPEEFRELREPLMTYMRTLFPMIKNPRAIKNLILRGIYFTSATQEGELILKHVTERLGADVASQFPTLDLYPTKRPYFIKDLLFRKVFPEHGLVFRNEQQALRNRKLAKLLKVGSVVMAVMLFSAVGLSTWKFGNIINDPREEANRTKTTNDYAEAAALSQAKKLGDHVVHLDNNRFWANVLSMWVGASEPADNLNIIRARLFERDVLAPALSEVSKALRSRDKLPDPRREGDEAQNFLDALGEYVAWYGSMDESAKTDHLDYDSFRAMCKVVKNKDSFMVTARDNFLEQADAYFRVIKREEEPTNPASLLGRAGIEPRETISQALTTVHAYFGNYARLDDDHPVPLIRDWMFVQTRCAEMLDSYATLVAAADVVIETADDLNDFKTSFLASYDQFQAAADNVVWRGEKDRSGFVQINPLADAILSLRNDHWVAYAERLKEAYGKGGADPDASLMAAIDTLVGGGQGLRGVDRTLCDSLNDARLAERGWFPDFFGENYAQFVREIDVEYDHVITLTRAGEAPDDDKLSLADAARTVSELLAPVAKAVRGVECETGKDAASRLPENWIATLDHLLYEVEEDEDDGAGDKLDSLDARWSPEELALLYETYRDLIARGQGTCLLDTIERGLNDDLGIWGFAELHPDWRAAEKSGFYIRVPDAPMAPVTPKAKAPKITSGGKKKKKRGRSRPSFMGGSRPRESDREARPRRRREDLKPLEGEVPACAKADFLGERAMQAAQLIFYLREFGPDLYFQGEDDYPSRNEQLADRTLAVWQTYADAYVDNWSEAYDEVKLPKLDKLTATPGGWAELAKQCRTTTKTGSVGPRAIGDEFRPLLSEILRATRWATYLPEYEWWTGLGGDAAQDWHDLASAMADSIQGNWAHGAFASNATEVGAEAGRREPWVVVSNELADRWAVLCKAMADSRRLPTDFASSSPKNYSKMRIPWGKLQELRDEARLDGEEISGQLVTFEKHAQRLLSAELTNILVGLQAQSFADQTPVGGWPYLTDDTYSETALRTVDFKSFRTFLRKVDWARATFEQIESGLSDDDPWRAGRQEFYTRCREWKDFIGLSSAGKPSPLGVDIEIQDPLSAPLGPEQMDDTAQFTYENVELELGLRLSLDEGAQGSADRALRIATLREEQKGQRSAIWKWPTKSGEAVLAFRFVDGLTAPGTSKRYPVIGRTLGSGSPLALCAYLEHYGRRDGDVVITSHALNLVEEFRKQGKNDLAKNVNAAKTRVGVKLVWLLEREMPRPIVKLEPADTPASPDSED